MLLRGWTLVVWALVAASAVFWGLRLFGTPQALPANTLVAAASPGVRADLTRLLGADAPPVVAAAAPPDARFHLLGVVSPRPAAAAREGLALIAVDGKPARAFRVGTVVDGSNVLQSVDPRGATLGPRGGAAAVALKLTPPAPAATGVLPAPGNPGFGPPLARPFRPNLPTGTAPAAEPDPRNLDDDTNPSVQQTQ